MCTIVTFLLPVESEATPASGLGPLLKP